MITSTSIDSNSQSFETSRENNSSVAVPRDCTLLDLYDDWSFETLKIKIIVSLHKAPWLFWVMTVHIPLNPFPPTPPTSPPKKNTVPILSVSYSLKCQHKNRTHCPGQKLPQPVKEDLCIQMDGKTSHDVQCYKLRALTKVIGFIINI